MAAGEVVAVLRAVRKTVGAAEVLRGVDAVFRRGELTLIQGGRGAGRTTLARLLVGQTLPTDGVVRRVGVAAPIAGAADVFRSGAPALEGLDMRAACYGLSTDSLIGAVARLMTEPAALRLPFGRLAGEDRQIVLYAASWLIPADFYVADGPLLPNAPAVRARLAPLLAQARSRAAVAWIAESRVPVREPAPDAYARLERGRLIQGDPQAAARPRRGRRRGGDAPA